MVYCLTPAPALVFAARTAIDEHAGSTESDPLLMVGFVPSPDIQETTLTIPPWPTAAYITLLLPLRAGRPGRHLYH